MSESANSSFVNGGSEEDNEPANNINDDSESDEDSNDELECDNLGISTNESPIENIINTIMQLRPESPTNTSCLSISNNSECDAGTSTLLPNVELPKKSPHCCMCHHARAGHCKGLLMANVQCVQIIFVPLLDNINSAYVNVTYLRQTLLTRLYLILL